jgi:hypothetical protein
VNGRLRVTPGDRLMAERESVIRQHRDDLVSLVRELDNGVQFRRSLFVRQLESTPAPAVPCFLVTPGLPYQRGICFSCGDPSEATRFRRCWRCSLAWQLATGVGQPK